VFDSFTFFKELVIDSYGDSSPLYLQCNCTYTVFGPNKQLLKIIGSLYRLKHSNHQNLPLCSRNQPHEPKLVLSNKRVWTEYFVRLLISLIRPLLHVRPF
jgi:hypothetical protein